MLSKNHLKDVCLVDSSNHARCRYLAEDESERGKYYCLKKSSKAKDIDIEVQDFLMEMQMKGKDPKKQNVPLGNNCGGYVVLRHKEQGYDKD
ncbi:MAG: hypothetical protein EB127_27395 [Alphaproteobacteria bacterium]|nr:hypothetical protein [Alphaproteobacteria bacterium]